MYVIAFHKSWSLWLWCCVTTLGIVVVVHFATEQMAMGNKQTEIGPSTRPRREEQKPRMACDERREIAETHRRNDRQPHGENVQNHIICLPTLKMNEYKNELFNYWRGPRVQRIHHVSCAHTEDRLVSFSCGLIFCSHFFICLLWLQSRKKRGRSSSPATVGGGEEGSDDNERRYKKINNEECAAFV